MFLEDAAYYEDQSDPRAVTHICLDECQLCQWGRWQVQKREKYQNTCQAKDQHLRATAQLQMTSFMMLVKNLTKMSPIQSYDQYSQLSSSSLSISACIQWWPTATTVSSIVIIYSIIMYLKYFFIIPRPKLHSHSYL